MHEQRPSQSRHLYTLLSLVAQNQGMKIRGLNEAIYMAKAGMLENEVAWVEKQVAELYDENGTFIEFRNPLA